MLDVQKTPTGPSSRPVEFQSIHPLNEIKLISQLMNEHDVVILSCFRLPWLCERVCICFARSLWIGNKWSASSQKPTSLNYIVYDLFWKDRRRQRKRQWWSIISVTVSGDDDMTDENDNVRTLSRTHIICVVFNWGARLSFIPIQLSTYRGDVGVCAFVSCPTHSLASGLWMCDCQPANLHRQDRFDDASFVALRIT